MNKQVPKNSTKLLYSNPKSREVLKQKVRQVFNLFDTDGSGEIDAKEFHDLIYAMGKIMTDEEVAKYLAVLDRDGNGSISFDEFFDWWCTREDTPSKAHSVDKLKEVKAKLQSRSWMRSISYLINKAKKDLEAEKAKAQDTDHSHADSITAKSGKGQDPNTYALDAKITIGNMAPKDVKASAKLSYMAMKTSDKIYRLEFVLTEGATEQDAEKIKQLFVGINAMTMGLLYTDISVTCTKHGSALHATVEMRTANVGPAETVLKTSGLSKLQFFLESSQRVEELDFKTICLNMGMHLEASKLILGLLPTASEIGPLYHGLLTMTRRVAFELNFESLHKAVISTFNLDARYAPSEIEFSKRGNASRFRAQMAAFGVNPDLPIAELRQAMVQIDTNAFVLDLTGVDISFLFKDPYNRPSTDAPKAPEVTTPQPVPVEVPVTVPEVPKVEPQVVPQAVPEVPKVEQPEVAPAVHTESEATKKWWQRFTDITDITSAAVEVEGLQAEVDSLFDELHIYEANEVLQPFSNKINPVILSKSIPKNLVQRQREADLTFKLVGYPFLLDSFDAHYDGPYEYRSTLDYDKLGYVGLQNFALLLAQKAPAWADKEPIVKSLAQKLINAGLLFSKDYVTHSFVDSFIVHPETLDCRFLSLYNFRSNPVPLEQVPEMLPVYNIPPELFNNPEARSYGSEFDVWGYGLICYILFTGNFPYDFSLGEEVMNHIVAGDYLKTLPEYTALSDKAKNFLARILAADKNARPTFQDLSNDEFFHLNYHE